MTSVEGTPNFEDNDFQVTEDQVVEALKEKGDEDTEVIAVLLKLQEQYKKEANNRNTSLANIEVDMKLAKIYAKAGYTELALESLEELTEMAASEGDGGEQILSAICELIDNIEAGDIWKI